MKDQPKTPRSLASRLKRSRAETLRAIADRFAERARRARRESDAVRWAQAAAHYRALAKLEEQVDATRPKPPAPSI
jgi:hypothetical protein